MEPQNLFGQSPSTPEPIIAQVVRELVAEEAVRAPRPQRELDQVARAAVLELWGARVKAFVPVLALRDARERLVHPHPAAPGGAVPTPGFPARTARRSSDVVGIDGDVLALDPADMLSIDE